MIIDPRILNNHVVTSSCDDLASKCLRVAVATANVGDGDLWLQGNSNLPGVFQRRFRRDGSTTAIALPNAVFQYHPAHEHIHLQNWTNLRLRKHNSTCNTENTATNCPIVGNPGQKLSFCLTETSTFDSSYSPNPNRAKTCDWNEDTGAINQGIGSGKSDMYQLGLYGQLIGIEGLPSGTYWLEVEVNPADANGQRTIIESDYSNNISRIVVNL